jgi:hypothetical protein
MGTLLKMQIGGLSIVAFMDGKMKQAFIGRSFTAEGLKKIKTAKNP